MPVLRVEKNSNYTVMSNYHLTDRRLSLKAKGLLSVILSLPDDWSYSIGGLVAICAEKECAVKSALKELKDNGYIRVDKLTPAETDSGRFEYVYTITEKPHAETQEVETQEVEKQGVEILGLENHPLYKDTNEESTNIQKTDGVITRARANRFDGLTATELKELLQFDEVEAPLADTVLHIIGDFLRADGDDVTICGSTYPRDKVKDRLLRLEPEEIEFVCNRLKHSKIRNMPKYALALLFNARIDMDNYFTMLADETAKMGC